MHSIPCTTCSGVAYKNSPDPFLFTAATLNSSALPEKAKGMSKYYKCQCEETFKESSHSLLLFSIVWLN